MFCLSLCGILFFLGLVNTQFDISPADYVGNTRQRDVINGNDLMGSQTFSGNFRPFRDPLREGLVNPGEMFINLDIQNESPFRNFGRERIRVREDRGHHQSGRLDNHRRGPIFGRAHNIFDAERQLGDQGVLVLPGDTSLNHRRDGHERYHEHSSAGEARLNYRLWSSRPNGIGVTGGQLAPEASRRDFPSSPIGGHVAARSGNQFGGDLFGLLSEGHEIYPRNRRRERGWRSERTISRDTSRGLIRGALAGLGLLMLG